ncbi:MAG TPA: hypothetical protein VF458_18905, partial [Ktedonobacteraceae bacterium]
WGLRSTAMLAIALLLNPNCWWNLCKKQSLLTSCLYISIDFLGGKLRCDPFSRVYAFSSKAGVQGTASSLPEHEVSS